MHLNILLVLLPLYRPVLRCQHFEIISRRMFLLKLALTFYCRFGLQVDNIYQINASHPDSHYSLVTTGYYPQELFVAINRNDSAMIYRLQSKLFDDLLPDYQLEYENDVSILKPVRKKRQIADSGRVLLGMCLCFKRSLLRNF